MQRAYGLEIPQTLEEVCDPRRMALLVYDMQEGIVRQRCRPQVEAGRARTRILWKRQAFAM